ncbi:MAG TPA: CocE/NonD family hydrolase, partial [Blastocatellia bacterium]|nr:CocE/NonD family hydrolase [Blastocatellia bacterium]
MTRTKLLGPSALFVVALSVAGYAVLQESTSLKTSFTKAEFQIPMRDGTKLFTAVYAPRDTSQKYPILLTRTPYSIAPYGKENYARRLGPSALFAKEGYIVVYQDVRGKHMSEGQYVDVRPHNPNKKTKTDIDEASDTYDTIEWLLKNVPNHNGRVGMWGISYPGFYTTTGILSGHPALKAASPQAPIADWFIGDDDHHNGALFLMDSFSFNLALGWPRPQPTTSEFREFSYGTADGYKFYLELGPVANAQRKYFRGQVAYWNELIKHSTYDEFWQARNILPHLKNIKAAVLTVGGWYDAEDLYGPLKTYQTIEKNNPGITNHLIMGPWCHGCWSGSGEQLAGFNFGSRTGTWYQENVELPFFNYYLKDQGKLKLPEATIFETGVNEWRAYPQWPPTNTQERSLYLRANGKLSFEAPTETAGYDQYVSDPTDPVPYSAKITMERGTRYMIEDQRFAAKRADVLSYQSDELKEDLTLTGPIVAQLFAATSGTDSDFIVKLIDVLPDGTQMLVRWEVMRGKFRNR